MSDNESEAEQQQQMEGMRSFVNTSEAVNFIIRLRAFAGIEPFKLTNNWTGEQLSLRQMDETYWLLVRCPIGREEDKWTNWEKEAIEWKWRRQWNLIRISLSDGDIGDGMVESNEGPSEPTD
uniref:Ubiquitinyl hydrolase 1 n=1 Tax=Globodera pallida TaxID=36090 RepID=A0A183BW04_GLOPA